MGEELEAIRGIIQEEFKRFREDVIEPIQVDAQSCVVDRSKIWDCTTGLKEEQASQRADLDWIIWAVRGVAMTVIGEMVAIGIMIFY